MQANGNTGENGKTTAEIDAKSITNAIADAVEKAKGTSTGSGTVIVSLVLDLETTNSTASLEAILSAEAVDGMIKAGVTEPYH